MPTTMIDRARELVDREKTLSKAELIDLWTGRQAAAWEWFVQCDDVLRRLKGHPDPDQLDLEVNRVVEATAPAAARALPQRP